MAAAGGVPNLNDDPAGRSRLQLLDVELERVKQDKAVLCISLKALARRTEVMMSQAQVRPKQE